jgi:archaellum component FlaC
MKMTVEDAVERRLARKLVEILGEEAAEALMAQHPHAASVITREDLDAMEHRLNGRLDAVEGRLDGVEGRLTAVEGRLGGVEGRLTAVEGRLDRLDVRLGDLDTRLAGVHQSMRDLREDVSERIDLRTASVKDEMVGALHQMSGTLSTEMALQTRTFVFAMLGMLVTLAALAFTALQIT